MAEKNNAGLYYPLTKMNFIVSVENESDVAAFTEVTGIDSNVDVIEFRQGNANSLAPVKIPGLVKHGNITLKMGYVRAHSFKNWIIECVSEQRQGMPRRTVSIELVDISDSSPTTIELSVSGSSTTWILKEAWVTKYSGADLNASTSEVAIESVEIAYEELTLAN